MEVLAFHCYIHVTFWFWQDSQCAVIFCFHSHRSLAHHSSVTSAKQQLTSSDLVKRSRICGITPKFVNMIQWNRKIVFTIMVFICFNLVKLSVLGCPSSMLALPGSLLLEVPHTAPHPGEQSVAKCSAPCYPVAKLQFHIAQQGEVSEQKWQAKRSSLPQGE